MNRSMLYYRHRGYGRRPLDEGLVAEIKAAIKEFPRYGLDRIHNHLSRNGIVVNRKAVHRVLKRKG